jgi:hypothetical protein
MVVQAPTFGAQALPQRPLGPPTEPTAGHLLLVGSLWDYRDSGLAV